MDSQETLRRKGEAEMIITHPLFKEAWEKIEADILKQMKVVPREHTLLHSRLIDALQTFEALRKHFIRIIDTGKTAEFKLVQGKRRAI